MAGPGIRGWYPLSMSDPTLFTALLYGALSHRKIRDKDRGTLRGPLRDQEDREALICESTTIRLLNEAMNDPSRAVTDAVILSVLCMAANSHQGVALTPSAQSPFYPPLRNLQWLDVYGTLSANPVHVRGLAHLIELRGGLENMALPGLAATIS
jgi:hypothetical protein